MEMRSLTRCVRSRPTTNVLINRPNHFLSTRQAAPFSSTSPAFFKDDHKTYLRNKSSRNQRLQANPNSNINEILDTLNLKTKQRTPNPSRTPTQHSQQQPGSAPGSGVPAAGFNAWGSSLTDSRRNVSPIASRVQNRPGMYEFKTNPQLGRYVAVQPERGVDLDLALKRLARSLTENNVKQDMQNQRYHVRRGQKEKNLRMARWRKLFKFSFVETVSKIQRMRKQGW